MRPVSFATYNPYVLRDAANPRVRRRTIAGAGLLYEPPGPSQPRHLPAVVVMEGLGGLKACREPAYGERLARQGYVALVVDSFGPRGLADAGHNRRAVRVTESMMLADAHAALRFLADHPRVDPRRIAVMGFSYGGMISVAAAYRQIRELFADEGLSFAAHASYYGCSVPRFDDSATTGAPVLMLLGELDENVSVRRARDIAGDLRAGGSEVTVRVYPETFHQWDGDDVERRHVGLNLGNLRFRVTEDNRVVDERTGLVMRGPLSRRLMIGLGVSRLGYDIQASARAKGWSDEDLHRFLTLSIGEPEILTRNGCERRSGSMVR
ncbi:dienelactone hydrolase family protein [Azospirillum halopraeferens]|uniref:dienelactone hydrolase family protein n=1 Tax=Azospirillum halopraeferens TaxID=34010 RepID=UPI000426AFAE|nr:dienelactone hydrolase family protein [Azospirillum halopraeferens]